MKRSKTMMAAFLAAMLAAGLALAGCKAGGSGGGTPDLVSIAVTTPPTQTIYDKDDPVADPVLAGLVVTGTYSNGSTAAVTVTAANISGFSTASADPALELTVTVGGQTAAFTVAVVDPAAVSAFTGAGNAAAVEALLGNPATLAAFGSDGTALQVLYDGLSTAGQTTAAGIVHALQGGVAGANALFEAIGLAVEYAPIEIALTTELADINNAGSATTLKTLLDSSQTTFEAFGAGGEDLWAEYAALTPTQQNAVAVAVYNSGAPYQFVVLLLEAVSDAIATETAGATPEATPVAAIDYANETLTGLTASAGYTVDGVTKTADASGTIAIETGWFNTTLSIVKTGDSTNTTDSAAQPLPIPARPATPTGLTPTQPSSIGGTGGINGTSNTQEYSTDHSTWTSITGTSVTGLAVNTYYVRVKATVSAFKSEEASVTISPYGGATPEATPTAAISYTNETLTGLTAGENYTVNSVAKTATGGIIAIETGWFGTTLSIVKTGDSTNTTDSAAQSLPISARPAAPAVSSGGVAKITGASAAMEYSSTGTSPWTTYGEPVAAGSYYVRVKQAGTNFAGANSAQVTVVDPGSLGVTVDLNISQQITVTRSDGGNVNSITISRGAVTPTALTLTATGFTSGSWYLDAEAAALTTGNTVTLNASALDVRGHSITFVGEKSGIPYAKEIPFTVVE
jgi:hypothetical protein